MLAVMRDGAALMDVRVAKEYLHIRDWLALAQTIVDARQPRMENFAGPAVYRGRGRVGCPPTLSE